MHQEGLSFPVPCALPASVCRFLLEHGEEIFQPPTYVSVGSSGRTVAAPQFKWLCGSLICDSCYFPIPYKSGVFSKHELAHYLEKLDCSELPFKTCTACQSRGFKWIG